MTKQLSKDQKKNSAPTPSPKKQKLSISDWIKLFIQLCRELHWLLEFLDWF
ncbi:hypothetical protein [Paenibacillus shenyangensis]|uniref:hypothetical protein n=1 Tax=Paenibacillus sp. A9 TaxID=1284352 RepID=UPI00036D1563|nr:hypothetical protein [Paenibacillus sp. A9]